MLMISNDKLWFHCLHTRSKFSQVLHAGALYSLPAVLTFVLLVHLEVDLVDALLDVVPGEELLSLGQRLGSEPDEGVSVPGGGEGGRTLKERTTHTHTHRTKTLTLFMTTPVGGGAGDRCSCEEAGVVLCVCVCVCGGGVLPVQVVLVHVAEAQGGVAQLLGDALGVLGVQHLVQHRHRRQHLHGDAQLRVAQPGLLKTREGGGRRGGRDHRPVRAGIRYGMRHVYARVSVRYPRALDLQAEELGLVQVGGALVHDGQPRLGVQQLLGRLLGVAAANGRVDGIHGRLLWSGGGTASRGSGVRRTNRQQRQQWEFPGAKRGRGAGGGDSLLVSASATSLQELTSLWISSLSIVAAPPESYTPG